MRILVVGTLCCVLLLGSDARRVRISAARPIAEDQEDEQQQVVYVKQSQGASGDAYNGLYGQSLERADDRYERPAARATIAAQPVRAARVKDTPREPPVETIRNYSNINDDGSFTFGYESADGSFKEETRGTDCVVRGKYGYVDPDGNKREFTYVSGNPCDPNAPQEEEEKEVEDSGEENVPANIPRPLRPLRPQQRPAVAARQPTTVFQNSYNQGNEDEEEEQQQQVYVQQPAPRPRPVLRTQPQPIVRVTPRPAIPTSTLPATTYRPQLLVSVTPRPNVVLSKHTTASQQPTTLGSLNFDEELKRFQYSNGVTTPRPATASPITTLKAATPTGQPVYTSELVYDPSSGQYNTVVYQQLPKTSGELSLKTRLPQYVAPTVTPNYVTPTPPALRPTPAVQPQSSSLLQQQLFNQKNQALFQQSQDLYSQQRLQQLQSQHRFQNPGLAPAGTRPLSQAPQKFSSIEPQRPLSLPQFQPETTRPAQQYYYYAPQQDVSGQSLSSGQIDAFLRNHSVQF